MSTLSKCVFESLLFGTCLRWVPSDSTYHSAAHISLSHAQKIVERADSQRRPTSSVQALAKTYHGMQVLCPTLGWAAAKFSTDVIIFTHPGILWVLLHEEKVWEFSFSSVGKEAGIHPEPVVEYLPGKWKNLEKMTAQADLEGGRCVEYQSIQVWLYRQVRCSDRRSSGHSQSGRPGLLIANAMVTLAILHL